MTAAQTIERLQAAVGTGEVLRIIYYGGSQPGAVREVVPIALKEGRLWALCVADNQTKSYTLDKVALPGPDDANAPEYAREEEQTWKRIGHAPQRRRFAPRPVERPSKPQPVIPQTLRGRTFVFTGKLESCTRSEAQELVRACGGDACDNLVGATTDLVVGEKPGGKLTRALKQGIHVMGEDEFLRLVEEARDVLTVGTDELERVVAGVGSHIGFNDKNGGPFVAVQVIEVAVTATRCFIHAAHLINGMLPKNAREVEFSENRTGGELVDLNTELRFRTRDWIAMALGAPVEVIVANLERFGKIAFTYHLDTGEEIDCDLLVQRLGLRPYGYYLDGICRASERPPRFWPARIVGDITLRDTGETLPVREWLALVLEGSLFNFAPLWKPRQLRYLQLIADFPGDYARGWRFAVGKWFRDQLDIKCTDIRNTPPGGGAAIDVESLWTQGTIFSFAEGHMIYDAPIDRQMPWRETLRHFGAVIQIDRATPNAEGESGKIHPGQVMFHISTPNADRSALRKIGYYHASQNEFVEFLRTGALYGVTLEQLIDGAAFQANFSE